MSDLINKTLEELIEFCKEKGINYLTKAKKPMAKKTIINNLKKAGLIDDDDEDDDLDTETTDINVIIRKTHNYLYKNSGIVGSKAQNDIMRVLILKIFNILLSKNNSYLLSVLEDANISDKCLIDDDEIIKYKSYIYDISNLLKEPDIKNVWLNFIGGFMSKLFDNIYVPEDANFNTPNDYDITRLIKIISKFIITDEFIDEFFMKNGDIHESFLKYQGNVNSKELGQFFTPKPIIKSLLNECGFKDLILNKEGSNLSLCDLCMGTGGLLCYTYNYCKEKINPSKIYGCEIEKDTIKFGNASLMISTNQYNSNILRCNSLIENPYLFNKENDKFDIIFINPPFGTKTNYKSLKKLFNNYKNKITTRPEFNGNSEIEFKDIYPIISNTGTELFIQLVIYSLKKDGLACIILPDGELMTSNNMTIRKYILDNCQLLKVINIQGGTFTNTGVKTKALIIKKCNNDNYNQDIEFIELNQEVKVLGIRKLNEKIQFTFEDKKEEIINYNKEIEIKTLGEIASINIGGTPKRDNLAYYNNGTNPWVSIRELDNNIIYDTKEKITDLGVKNSNVKLLPINTILFAFKLSIGKIGIAGVPLYTNEAIAGINTNDDNIIINKYLYYYLYHTDFKHLASGILGNVGSLNKKILEDLKIPIPSIEIQNKIVEYLDMIYETVIKNNNEKIENIKKLNKNYLELNLQFNKDIEIKTLGEIASINQGKLLIKNDMIDGLYDVIGGGKIIGTHNINNRDGDDVIITRVGDININYISNAYYLTDNAFSLKTLNNNIMITKYLYYIILNNKQYLKDLYIGTAQKVISKTNLSNVKIPIPTIEKQEEIIKYLEFNDELIKTLEKENEINKNNAELLMKQILYK
jgi:type I restriction-modification system DNA methylase subunit